MHLKKTRYSFWKSILLFSMEGSIHPTVQLRMLCCQFYEIVVFMLYANLLHIGLEAYLDRKTWSRPCGMVLALHMGVESVHRLQQSLAWTAAGKAALSGRQLVQESPGRLSGWYYTQAGRVMELCVSTRTERNGSLTSQVWKRTLPLSTIITVCLIQNPSCAEVRCQVKREYLFLRFSIWSLEKPLDTGVTTACVSVSNQNQAWNNPPIVLERFWIFGNFGKNRSAFFLFMSLLDEKDALPLFCFVTEKYLAMLSSRNKDNVEYIFWLKVKKNARDFVTTSCVAVPRSCVAFLVTWELMNVCFAGTRILG